jgi:large-conductance mechanosensitive channel
MDFSSFNQDSSISQQTQQQPTLEQTQQQQPTQQQKQLSIHEKIHNFLLSKTGTIITTACAMTIGFAFKDVIASIVTNLFKPLLAFIFSLTHLNNYYNFNSILSPENNAINFGNLITSFITFIMIIISVYLISSNYQ